MESAWYRRISRRSVEWVNGGEIECEEWSAPGYKRIKSEPAVKRKKLTDTLTSRELASEEIDGRVRKPSQAPGHDPS
jgi:hypothetical protein